MCPGLTRSGEFDFSDPPRPTRVATAEFPTQAFSDLAGEFGMCRDVSARFGIVCNSRLASVIPWHRVALLRGVCESC